MKIIKIDTCSNCPHIDTIDADNGIFFCKVEDRDWKYTGEIPSWCPLEDAYPQHNFPEPML